MAYPQRGVSPEKIQRAHELRAMPLLDALFAVGAYSKEDPTFVPVKHPDTRRFHVSVDERDYELLICRDKWYDTREKKGGGGAIDLMMHVYSEPFNKALRRLEGAVQ